jgi:hypothetical protein
MFPALPKAWLTSLFRPANRCCSDFPSRAARAADAVQAASASGFTSLPCATTRLPAGFDTHQLLQFCDVHVFEIIDFHGSGPSSSDMRPKFPSEETGTATAFRPDVCSTRSRSLSSTNFVSSGESKEDDETANTGTTSQRNGFANEIAKALYHHARANLFE